MFGRVMHLPVSGAIVLSGALIASGLFFGLQARSAPRESQAFAVASDATTSASPATPTMDVATSAARRTQLNNLVATQVAAALEAQRADLRRQCWLPSFKKVATPPVFKLTFGFSLGPDGRQIARGVIEDRATSRPEVRDCITSSLAPIAIDPVGVSTSVELPLNLP